VHKFPVIEVGGFHLDLSTIVGLLVSCVIVFALARAAVRNLSVDNPSKLQNFMEWVVEFVHNTIASTMPLHMAKKFIALGMTLIMFIFVSNLLGLPFGIVMEVKEDHHGPVEFLGFEIISAEEVEEAHHEGKHLSVAFWKSPTADLSVTAGLAIMVFVLVHWLGLARNTKHYLKHYFEPYWFFLPLNILKELAKPLTLALRLFANIFVGAIQAFLFTILTMVYISQAAVHHEEEH